MPSRPARLLLLLVALLAAAVTARPTTFRIDLQAVAAHGVAGLVSPHGAAPAPNVYVAIGASDSYGIGTADPATESWPAVLDGYLAPSTRFVNLGVPGITLHRALETEAPIAVDAHPGLVTIFLAVNDLAGRVSLDSYEADLNAMLDLLRRRTHARVLVANLPDLTLVASLAGRTGVAVATLRWNAVIDRAVAAHGDVLVDLYAHWRDLAAHPDYIGPDGLHPTADGYRQLAALFWQTYRAALSH